MKAIMYHYVRCHSNDLPFFTYLHVDNFKKQIKYFAHNYKILSLQETLWCLENNKVIKDGIILTFDDGLADHYEYVYPILKDLGLWGIFYVSTLPYERHKLLDVHRIHYMLGRYGGKFLYEQIQEYTNPSSYMSGNFEKFSDKTYLQQSNDFFTTEVKRTFNYYLRPEVKSSILNVLMEKLCEDEALLAYKYYLNKERTLEMVNGGMSIGCHGHTHTLLSNLTYDQQKIELVNSTKIIENLTNARHLNSFCYPFGGKSSYDLNTLEILESIGFDFSFSVESRNIEVNDLVSKYEIPRFDCNQFKFGQITKV